MQIIHTSIKKITRYGFVGLLSILMVASSISFILAPTAAAQTCDTDFYNSNNIVFFNPCEGNTCSAIATGGTAAQTSLSGKDNLEKIYNYWVAQGLTPAQSAGITGSIQHESGFSPFRQEMSQSWPGGGWGIAQFTFGQRTAATEFVSNEIGAATFNEYYKNEFGGGVNAENGYVPSGVPLEVNDAFLLAELNYLSNYTSSFAPSTINLRVSLLSEHWNLHIDDGMKLLDYLKTVESAHDVAVAWTYLYEFPGDIKNTAGARGDSAEELLTSLGATSSSSCDVIGSGGLNFNQSVELMKYYLQHREDNGDLSGYSVPELIYQCTAFSYWFTTKFEKGSYNGDGFEVVPNLLANAPSGYTSVTKNSIKPYTVFSQGTTAPGHTGIVLGVNPDGSVIIGESNVIKVTSGEGIVDATYIKDAKNKSTIERGLMVTHWESIDAWEKTWGELTFAAPTDSAGTANKVKTFMQTIQTNSTPEEN